MQQLSPAKKLRVLLINEATNAGVGKHVLDLAGGLIDADYEVHLIYSTLRIDKTFSGRLEQMPELFRQAVSMRRSPHPSDLSAVMAARKYMRQHGPFDIIHGHSSKGGAIARLAGVGLPAKVIYTPNAIVTMNPEFSKPVLMFYEAIERILGWSTDTIIATGEEERGYIKRVIREDRILFLPNGMDPPAFLSREQARDILQLPHDQPVIGFVGRMCPQKDPFMMVEAFARVHAQFPQAVLCMIGDGELLEEVRQRVVALGLESCVRLPGRCNSPELMQAFDIFALSSRYEAMPYVFLDALHAGLPIVSMAVSSADLIIQDGASGHIVKSHVAEDFAKSLCEVLADSGLRQRYSEAAKARAPQFTLNSMVEKTTELYHRLCGH
jgi:glycosyltransferase involved in cell wall biosynthesis